MTGLARTAFLRVHRAPPPTAFLSLASATPFRHLTELRAGREGHRRWTPGHMLVLVRVMIIALFLAAHKCLELVLYGGLLHIALGSVVRGRWRGVRNNEGRSAWRKCGWGCASPETHGHLSAPL